MSTSSPLLALTLGDIAGVGPEIVAKVLADSETRELAHLAVFGPHRPLRHAIDQFTAGIPTERVESAAELSAWDFRAAVPVVDDLSVRAPSCREVMGKVDADAGRSSHAAVLAAIDACLAGHTDAMVTAPIHKAAWSQAGVKHPGHTEVLAERTGTRRVLMMLACHQLKVILATIHIRLADVPRAITRERLADVIEGTAESMPLFGADTPRLAIAGLNPHAGDGGLFGDEEITVIGPAVEEARARGIDISGPFPADTVFARAKEGAFDAVIALYHDQGLAAIKTLEFERTVNISLGLPIIRTSVDHGTAFDIAGQGIASPTSLREAIQWATEMVENRRRRG
ncbi:4-hydroxythreonine-4-phosphate dehydrogenase PdxA [Candidatus Sumerlaeota bacterium]|nr:4-hydroxythreonine-4-phosphate dehydrogenase PdxA [Candidatus Sumerlaeota bacterium]